MKKLTLLLSICISLYSTAQNTFPTSGKAGVNTTDPVEALQVNGNLQVDSSMTVKDSIQVQGRTRTFELVVDGDAKFKGDVIMKQQLKVDSILKAKSDLIVYGLSKLKGDAHVLGNAKFDQELKVLGLTKLLGQVKMSNIDVVPDPTSEDLEFLIRTPDGSVYRADRGVMLTMMYEPFACLPGDVAMPQWFAGLNKLYSPCPPVNVGINTSDPLYKLDVRGTTYAFKLKLGNLGASEDAVLNAFALNNTQNLLKVGYKVGGLDEVLRLLVESNGSVHINKDDDGIALEINNGDGHAIVVNNSDGIRIMQLQNDGLLKTRKIRVDLDTWSDDVFRAGHQLQSLKEIEKYTAKNSHLPGIPSESELKEDGLDLAQMQQLQMEKIEELYLHLFEMNDKMEDMQQQLNQLQAENKELKAKLK